MIAGNKAAYILGVARTLKERTKKLAVELEPKGLAGVLQRGNHG